MKREGSLIKHETTEDRKTTIQRESLTNGQTTHSKRESERRQGAQRNNGHTGEKGTSEVKIGVTPVES